MFCSGTDLKALLAGERPAFAGDRRLARRRGYAQAGGREIVPVCGMLVAADSSRFGIPEVKRGLVAAAGGLLRLPQRSPYAIGDVAGAAVAGFGAVERHPRDGPVDG
ncbi:enoyl-CoA hydratase-related protein [Streptomyces sp. 900116325]